MSVANGAPTPRRTTRAASTRQQTPLPALETRQSHAYGARGKTQLNAQMITNTADIDAVFTTNAQKTRASTGKEPTPAPPTASRARKSKQRVQEPEPNLEEELEDRPNGAATNGVDSGAGDDRFRPDTRLDTSLSYGIVPEARKSAATPKGPSPSPAPPAKPSPVPSAQVEPPRWKILSSTLADPRVLLALLTGFLVCSGLLLGLVGIYSCVPLPARYALSRDAFFYRVRTVVYGHGTPEEALWFNMKNVDTAVSEGVLLNMTKYTTPETQYLINQVVFDRLGNAEQAARQLKDTVGLHRDSLQELRQILPLKMAMTTRDGQWHFEDNFLQAFAERVISSNATAPLWDKLMASNEERMFQVHQGNVQTMVNGAIQEIKVVTQEQLQEAIIENNDHFERNFNSTMLSFKTMLTRQFEEVAEHATSATLEKSYSTLMSKTELGSLAYSMLIENTNRRMREVNYLSIGLGAVVVPLYTSPTFTNPVLAQSWYEWFLYRTGLKIWPPLPFVPTLPPTAALRDWKEGAECWCAAPTDDEMGLAQLTVQYPHKIYPDAIYVEHVPASGTHDIAAAPKQFEVWAQMENAAEAARVQEVLDREVNIRYGFECGPPPKHNSLRWVCFASGEYNIHYANHVQKVSTLFDAEEIGLATKMIAFRVKENWGSKDHTCIYRLRMIGKEVGSELRPIV